MKRTILALALSLALGVSMIASAAGQSAAGTEESASLTISIGEEESAGTISVETGTAGAASPDPEGTVSFSNLAARVRAHNLNVLILEENIAAIESFDYEQMQDNIRRQINSTANTQWVLTLTGNTFASASLQQSYDALRDAFDDLKDGKIQKNNADLVRQFRSAQDKVVVAAENLYVAVTEMEATQGTLRRGLAALDRTIQEMELRYQLGQISWLTLQQVKGQRTSLVSQQQTLDMNVSTYKMQLEQLTGAGLTGASTLSPLPTVSGENLSSMDLEADLEAARAASYDLYAAKLTLDDAKEDWNDSEKYSNRYHSEHYKYAQAQHTWQAAQYTYSAALQDFELRFRTLYQQVKDYDQVLQAAKSALALKRDEYAAAQVKYEQGNLSKNKLADARDEVSAAQDATETARRNLFSAYNSYRWAVDYGILN